MSETDSFIEEVTEEVRRDRLFATMRKYGWIGILAVVLIVGGAAFSEWRKAQASAAAQAAGDAMLAALEKDSPVDRVAALGKIEVEVEGQGPRAIAALLLAAEQAGAGLEDEAAATLEALAVSDGDLPMIYRQISSFKALVLNADKTDAATRRQSFEAMAAPGGPLRLLAEEQLALIDLETGDRAAAIARAQAILQDAEVTPGLRRRASQLIVALGGEPTPSPAEQGGQ